METPEGTKWCPDCKEVKGASEFGLNKRLSDGLARYCKRCNNGLGHFGDNTVLLELAAHYLDGEIFWPEFVILPEQRRDDRPVAPTRTYHLSQRYRIRHEDVERMIADQYGLCVVCWGRPPEHVDHCHRTGNVRYALCLPCNSGIGQFKDDSGVVRRAWAYIEATVEWLDIEDVSEEEIQEFIRADEEIRSDFYERAVRV